MNKLNKLQDLKTTLTQKQRITCWWWQLWSSLGL